MARTRAERAARSALCTSASDQHRRTAGGCRCTHLPDATAAATMIGSPATGLIGVLILLVLLVAGVPIGVALGLVGIGGLTLLLGMEPALIKSGVIVFDTLSRYE